MLHIFPGWVLYLLAGTMGAILGSFANVCIVRIPEGKSVVRPGSRCPSCGHAIRPWENIPLISYIFLRGVCSSCRNRISITYPMVELLSIVMAVSLWHHFREPVQFFIYLILFVIPLIIAALIDIRHMIIPDSISLTGIVTGFLATLYLNKRGSYAASALDSILGILIGGGLLFLVAYSYEKIKKREGLGGGDIKLAAMFGAFFGWRGALVTLFLSSIAGSAIGLGLMLFYRKDSKHPIPYGPFLVMAAIFYLFFGEMVVD
ncbi:MAG TPA: prepilin peptidase, partial [bacterium]|nr:prepilin peptidase [bacterium]